MNKVALAGHLGCDPEIKTTSGGTVLANFSLATTEVYKKEKSTTWHNCTAFGKTAELIVQYCKKGSYLIVGGKIDNKTVETGDVKKTYSSVILDWFEFGPNTNRPAPDQAIPERTVARDEVPIDDDLPF